MIDQANKSIFADITLDFKHNLKGYFFISYMISFIILVTQSVHFQKVIGFRSAIEKDYIIVLAIFSFYTFFRLYLDSLQTLWSIFNAFNHR